MSVKVCSMGVGWGEFVELVFYCVAYREVRVHVNYPLANGEGVGWVCGVGSVEV